MRFSIVIPALNEGERIGQAIKALRAQTVPRSDYEIVVVDAKSKDNTVEVAKAAGADIVISESTEGTNFARQRGVDVSHGNIVAFLDADCLPGSNWLEVIEKNLAQAGVAGVSGPYDYGFKGLSKLLDKFFSYWFLPRLSSILFFIFRRKAGVAIGGNFAATRKAINKIGGLPKLKFWGDDAAIATLLSRHVGKVVFNPKLVVKSSPRRFDKEGLFTLEMRYAKAYFKVYFSKDFE